MPNRIDLYDPRTLIGVTEIMAPIHTFLKDTFFSNVRTEVTEKIDIDMVKGSRKLAPFVHPVEGGKTVTRKGYKTETFTPPLIAPEIITTAGDLMKVLPGENIYSNKSPADRATAMLGKDLNNLDNMITRREEWMCAKALVEGKIPIVGDGLNEVIDFNFTNKITLSGNDLWNNDASDPYSNIESWYRQVQITGFVNPDILLVADDVATALINHPKSKELLDVKAYDLAVIAPKQLPNGVTYIGTIKRLGLDIYTYNEWFFDEVSQKTHPLIPDGKLLLLSSKVENTMAYGSVTLINKDTDNFMTVEGRRVPDTWTKKRPARRFLSLQSRPLPIPRQVDSWLVATVL